MSAAVCFVSADLTAVRVLPPPGAGPGAPAPGGGAPVEWPGAADAAETGPSARASEAAAWVAATIAPATRLDMLCVGVEQANCGWISAPSAAPEIVAAAVRQRGNEWGFEGVGATVQPLVRQGAVGGGGAGASRIPFVRPKAAQPSQRRQPEGAHVAVLHIRDAEVRLFLDELDRRGVRVGTVTTLWHAAALAWSVARSGGNGDGRPHDAPAPVDAPTVGIVLRGAPTGIVWAWGAGGALLAGGSIHATGPGREEEAGGGAAAVEAEAGRLALDWLTWSAQLSRCPDEVVVLGRDAGAFTAAFGRLWTDSTVTAGREGDPLADTLAALAAQTRTPEEDDPRACVVALTNRPARAHRRLYAWSAVALVMLALAVGGHGFRATRSADRFADRARQLSNAARMSANQIAPGSGDSLDPVRQLDSVLALERAANPPIPDPPPPRAIHDELVRVLTALAQAPEIDVTQIKIEGQPSVDLTLDAFRPGERLLSLLRESGGRIRWDSSFTGNPPNLSLRLRGFWDTETP